MKHQPSAQADGLSFPEEPLSRQERRTGANPLEIAPVIHHPLGGEVLARTRANAQARIQEGSLKGATRLIDPQTSAIRALYAGDTTFETKR